MRKIVSVSFFTGLLTLFKMGAGFAIGKVVAIYAGPGGLAVIGQLQGIASILTGITNSPVGPGIVKYTSEKSAQGISMCAYWWRAGLVWLLALCSIIIPLTVMFSEDISMYLFSESKYKNFIIVISLLLPLSGIGTFITSVINGFQHYKQYIAIGFASVFVSSLVMIVLTFKLGILGALIATSIQLGVIGVVIIFLSLKQRWLKVTLLWGRIEKHHFIDIKNYVLMALVSAFALPAALVFIRKIMIADCGWQDTGEWQAVWKISEAYLAIITMALATYYLPTISKLTDKKLIEKEVRNNLMFVFPLVVLMAIIIFILKDIIIQVLFTEEFKEARRLFLIQLVGDVIKVLAWLYSYVLLAKGMTKLFIVIELSFAFIFVLVSYLCIHYYGIEGANYAYAATYILYFVAVRFGFNKYV
ncbi:O-antigen translocase [Pseudocitrobacter cyperus]|uniref:O-antigen translocase n=1 Tax=Pseudocitrobacter cyperus TaxID=3112843 RepID=A0ABV0HMB6_9ENTR